MDFPVKWGNSKHSFLIHVTNNDTSNTIAMKVIEEIHKLPGCENNVYTKTLILIEGRPMEQNECLRDYNDLTNVATFVFLGTK
jgi:hypothetical protein